VRFQDKLSLTDEAASSDEPEPRFREPHYTVAEITKVWKLSPDVVRKIFEREPGVLVLGNDGSRAKRGYHTLRIPESVMERVHRSRCNPEVYARTNRNGLKRALTSDAH